MKREGERERKERCEGGVGGCGGERGPPNYLQWGGVGGVHIIICDCLLRHPLRPLRARSPSPPAFPPPALPFCARRRTRTRTFTHPFCVHVCLHTRMRNPPMRYLQHGMYAYICLLGRRRQAEPRNLMTY